MKKLLSLLLTGIVVMGLALPSFAVAGSHPELPQIYDIKNDILDGVYGDYMEDASWFPESTAPGSRIVIPLLKEGFRDETGAEIETWVEGSPLSTLGPTVRQLKYNGVVPRIEMSKGFSYIKSCKLIEFDPTPRNPARAAIEIQFVDDFLSTQELDYEFTVYLSLNNRITPTREIFGGRLGNEVFDVFKIDYLYIGDGQIAYAQSGTKMGLTLDLGNGVLLHRDMFMGERYYGVAKLLPNERQDPITKAYPLIDAVIDIKSVEMKVNGAYITFTKELAQKEYFVYNLAGDYIGKSSDKQLPFSSRYYLAKAEITIDPSLSQHPVVEGDAAKLSDALVKFLEGGRSDEESRQETK